MVETVLCFHSHCTTKRRGVKPEEELCSKPVSPAEIGTYGKKLSGYVRRVCCRGEESGKKIKAISCELSAISC
ncbi:MAG: hypothetical protein ACLTJQ_05125 [Dialister invisus]